MAIAAVIQADSAPPEPSRVDGQLLADDFGTIRRSRSPSWQSAIIRLLPSGGAIGQNHLADDLEAKAPLGVGRMAVAGTPCSATGYGRTLRRLPPTIKMAAAIR